MKRLNHEKYRKVTQRYMRKFINKCEILFKMALFENDQLSLTRLLALGGWILFAVVSVYMVVNQIEWNDYSTFGMLSGGGGAATQVANKLMNSKYNSAPGTYEASGAER